MDELRKLFSACSDSPRGATAAVAAWILNNPAALDEILSGLASKGAALLGDCAEVMTKVAECRPDLVAPHAPVLWGLIGHKNGRVRWESMHAFALAAAVAGEVAESHLAELRAFIRSDKSVIVRDYAIDAVAAHGRTSVSAARKALPILRESLSVWDGKHAARTLSRLGELLQSDPSLGKAINTAAEPFRDHERTSVRKAARAVLRLVTEQRT